MSIVYFIRRADGLIKIGSTDGYDRRMRQHHCRRYTYTNRNGQRGELVGASVLIGVCYGTREDERRLHERFAEYRAERDPILLHRFERELFELPAHVVAEIVETYGKPRESELRCLMVRYGADDEARFWAHIRRLGGSQFNEIGELRVSSEEQARRLVAEWRKECAQRQQGTGHAAE